MDAHSGLAKNSEVVAYSQISVACQIGDHANMQLFGPRGS